MVENSEKKPEGLSAEEYQRAMLVNAGRGINDSEGFFKSGFTDPGVSAVAAAAKDAAGRVRVTMAEKVKIPEAPDNSPEAQLRREYDQAFEQVFKGIEDHKFRMEMAGERAKAAAAFKKEHVGWVKVEGENYLDLDSADKRAKMAIVPKNHQLESQMGSFAGLSSDTSNVLLIKSVKVSRLFKAIALMDRLYYLYTKFSGLEPFISRPSRYEYLRTEMGTSLCAVGAMDFYSKGKYLDYAREFIKKNRLKNVDVALRLMKTESYFLAMVKWFDDLLAAGKSISKAEITIRAGLYLRAMIMTMAYDDALVQGEDTEALMLKNIEIFLMAAGHSANIPSY